MKAIKKLVLIACIVTFVSVHAQNPTVQGQAKLNTDFSQYKTFGWAKTDTTAQSPDGIQIFSYRESGEIKSPGSGTADIENEPGGSGKKKGKGNRNAKSKSNQQIGKSKNPVYYVYAYDVIVPSSDKTLNGSVQTNIQAELEGRGFEFTESAPDLLVTYRILERPAKVRGYVNDSPTIVQGREVREPGDTTTYDLEPGTLMVGLIDGRTSEAVWEGYASGLVEEDQLVTDETAIKESIHQVFQKFNHTASNEKR